LKLLFSLIYAAVGAGLLVTSVHAQNDSRVWSHIFGDRSQMSGDTVVSLLSKDFIVSNEVDKLFDLATNFVVNVLWSFCPL
jgi:hypothetical protein